MRRLQHNDCTLCVPSYIEWEKEEAIQTSAAILHGRFFLAIESWYRFAADLKLRW